MGKPGRRNRIAGRHNTRCPKVPCVIVAERQQVEPHAIKAIQRLLGTRVKEFSVPRRRAGCFCLNRHFQVSENHIALAQLRNYLGKAIVRV